MRRLFLTLCSLLGLMIGFTFHVGIAHMALPPQDPTPPSEPVKLIFIHHSTGGNWLADPNNDQPYGSLGRTLMENNYFVSATNYGWGPEGIGDRTDIINWPEWFLGPNRDTYLNALYNENGQNFGDFGAWSRMATDPGGENQIVMFKSCFPNSDLYGNPNDAAYATYNEEEYSVANAKAIYTALLTYFETRQDKLFIVITAPPLMQSETAPDRAANARAFNNWLVNDWLQNYPYANVAVFDYYNVLTHPDNHHRWNGSEIEHVQSADTNFSAYPSGDSHPNTEGHSKATEEFVPLLNIAYHRWMAEEAPPPPTTQADEPSPSPTLAAVTEVPTATVEMPSTEAVEGIVEDFESGGYWEPSSETGSTMACDFDNGYAHNGVTSLHLQYTIASDGWADCGHYFEDGPYNWSNSTGLAFWLRVEGASEWATLMLFSGEPDNPTPFEVTFAVAAHDWQQVSLPWASFEKAAWAGDEGLSAVDPARITGYGFSLGPGEGDLWIDDVTLLTGDIQAPAPTATDAAPADAPTEAPPTEAPTMEDEIKDEEEQSGAGGGLCASAPLTLSLVVISIIVSRRRIKKLGGC